MTALGTQYGRHSWERPALGLMASSVRVLQRKGDLPRIIYVADEILILVIFGSGTKDLILFCDNEFEIKLK